MDPTTGALKALVSNPGYDLNAFTGGISQEAYQALLDNPSKPLFNHAWQGLYPPGSVLKPFTAAFALEAEAISVNSEFNESIDVDENRKETWRPTGFGAWNYPPITRITLRNRPSPLNMYNGMVTSDNIYFAYAALRLGMEKYMAYTERMGLGEAIPFDLNVSKSQLLNKDTEFNKKLLADSGYGQGEVLITPLQLCATFGAFANGGDIMRPYIVQSLNKTEERRYISVETTRPQVWKENALSRQAIEIINPMLYAVTQSGGTARQLRLDDIRVAAKTGTAELGGDKSREIAWLAGFWLDGNEPRVALVMIEIEANSTYSGYRFDIAREMLRK
jgi:penicillin-binding protein